ncbi:hypothetical protein CRG98_027048 [Punica granatum]|uniref:Auxin-responsive protein n=1 Tax=Punica granatum TaxID=22663 RepID=A0A2I0JA81_PUNGR|nr:hypothetical protein CRG98_027048 [Punica granatum]
MELQLGLGLPLPLPQLPSSTSCCTTSTTAVDVATSTGTVGQQLGFDLNCCTYYAHPNPHRWAAYHYNCHHAHDDDDDDPQHSFHGGDADHTYEGVVTHAATPPTPCSSRSDHRHHYDIHKPRDLHALHGQHHTATVPRTTLTLQLPDLEKELLLDSSSFQSHKVPLEDSESSESKSNTRKYVKVMMEGVGIGRKVDLSLHPSFHALCHTLMDMFGICELIFK